MKPSEWENEKAILMDLMNQLENDFADFIHRIEDDETISDETFKRIDDLSMKPYSILTMLRNEIYYS